MLLVVWNPKEPFKQGLQKVQTMGCAVPVRSLAELQSKTLMGTPGTWQTGTLNFMLLAAESSEDLQQPYETDEHAHHQEAMEPLRRVEGGG